jgi:signal transduction histidine kinase
MTGPVLTDLLLVALRAVETQAGGLAASEARARELQTELDETQRGLLALHLELSEQQHQLELARAEAEKATEAKAAFLANMSHEIRSPMTAVIGFTSLLLDSGLGADQRDFAERIHRAGEHLRGVIDAILDLSKIESGHLELEAIPFDLAACVEDAVGIVATSAEEKGLALAALFSSETPTDVIGDPGRLRQILLNLLSNAVKFTDRGQVTVELAARSVDGDRCSLEIRVQDTGLGMPADVLDRLFTPFTQADASTARQYGGTGLGLLICRQLCQLMGGDIAVDSAEGSGSTFSCTITLGLAQPTTVADQDEPLAGVLALIVHHEPITADAIRRQLRSWGGETVVSATIEAAARRVDVPDFSFAVLDAGEGPAALAAQADLLARARGGRRIPIIAVVPLTCPRSPDEFSADVRAVMSTPVRRSSLRQAVMDALGNVMA